MDKTDLKYWLRSGSRQFMSHRRTKSRQVFTPGVTATYTYRGRPLHYRPGSSDVFDIYEILLKKDYKAAYWLPQAVDPRVILDIGANIGLAAVYLANRFPAASITCFEPMADNFALLRQNIAPYPQIQAYNLALGGQDGQRTIFASEGGEGIFTGNSFYGLGVDQQRASQVQVRDPASLLPQLGLGEIDLIKIDTEGAEWEILSRFDTGLLSRVKWIIGELHGIDDFKLLDYLSTWFLIDVKKTLNKRLFEFNALNRQWPLRLSGREIRRLQY